MAERPTRGPRLKAQLEDHGFSLDEVKEWKGQIEKAVHDHPILSASIAVGAGVLIARLIQDAVDDDTRKKRSHRRGGLFGSEIGRAVMGSLATMAAAKLQETLLGGLNLSGDDEEEEEPAPPRRKTRPRKQGRPATQRRPTQQRRRKPIVEE